MHIIVPQKNIVPLVQRCAATTDKTSAMAILKCVVLSARADGTVRVAGTNLYTTVEASTTATIGKPGGFCLAASNLADRLKAMPAGDIEISMRPSGTKVTIKSVSSKRNFTVHVTPQDEFPNLPKLPDHGRAPIQIAATTLGKLLRQTRFAISTDSSRAHVNSALLEIEPTLVRVVSTDGHRLCKAEIHEATGSTPQRALISLDAINLLYKIVSEAEQSKEKVLLDIWIEPTTIFVRVGTLLYTAKLTDANFPSYMAVLKEPLPPEEMAVCNRASLLAMVQGVTVAADDKRGTKLSFSKGKVTLSCKNPDCGTAEDEIPADYSGPDRWDGYNGDYIEEALTAIDTELVRLEMREQGDIFGIRPFSPEGSDYVCVIMPMRDV